MRLSKQQFYSRGGFRNPHQFRVTRKGKWTYWEGR